MPDHVGRRDDLAVDHVVGDVEEAGHELPVAGGHLRPQRLGVRDPLAPLHDEAALGTDGDDHRVLDHLGLHEPEHLGAEVLPAVAPAQPAAGHRPTPEVHALDAGRVHPDLEHRPGQRQVGDDLRVELEGEHRPGAGAGVAVDARAVGVRPLRGQDQGEERAEDAVLVQAGHGVELRRDRVGEGPGVGGADGAVAVGDVGIDGRVEPGLEQPHERTDDRRVAGQRRLDVALAERQADLAQVLGVGAEHVDLAGREPARHHELVQPVALELAPEERGEGVAELVPGGAVVDPAGVRDPQPDVVAPDAAPLDADLVGPLVDHRDAEVLEQRQHLGQHERRARAHQREAHLLGRGAQGTVQRGDDVGPPVDLQEVGDVGGGDRRRVGVPVVGREGVAVAGQRVEAGILAQLADERGAELVRPVRDDGAQALLDVGDQRVADLRCRARRARGAGPARPSRSGPRARCPCRRRPPRARWRSARPDRSSSGRAGGRRGRRRTGRSRPAARTGGPGAGPGARGCPSRSRTARRRRSGTARCGGTSRGSGAGPARCGSRPRTRPGPAPRRPCPAGAGCRARCRGRRRSCRARGSGARR